MKFRPQKTSLFLLFYLISTSFAFTQNAITPQTALKKYLQNGDKTYQWELKDSVELGSVKGYHLLLTSQKWREYTWRHQLTVFVPKEVKFDGAMLFITGGSNKDEQPNWSTTDGLWAPLAGISDKNKAIVALIKQVPNQPLYGNLTEDALISYTLNQFKQNKDYSFPLLFPMVKSAVKAMDAVQEFTRKRSNIPVSNFLVTGASKRGWTTWLSAAIDDKRVKAIAPMVIDMLNMPATLKYQYDTYGEYSEQIDDYVKLGIPQSTATADGKAINDMIDPFSYRSNLTVPKMIFIGTNDEYWTIDAIKHYYDKIPGKNLIHYVPNVGHNLGGGKQAFDALSAFFGTTIMNKEYPLPTWKVVPANGNLSMEVNPVTTDLLEATLWHTTSSDRDFRNNLWLSRNVKLDSLPTIRVMISFPKKGYQAFYLDLKYKDPNGGTYTTSTRVYVTDGEKVL